MTLFTKRIGIFAVAVITLLSVRELSVRSSSERSAPQQHASATATAASESVEGPMMLELYTPHCPSCLQTAPLISRLAQTCTEKGVSVVQIDISAEENEHLIDELNIEAVPTFVFIDKSGRETARLVGKQTEDTLESRLSDIGGAACSNRT